MKKISICILCGTPLKEKTTPKGEKILFCPRCEGRKQLLKKFRKATDRVEQWENLSGYPYGKARLGPLM